jgi:hypothetical protein
MRHETHGIVQLANLAVYLLPGRRGVEIVVDRPYFEDLRVGRCFNSAGGDPDRPAVAHEAVVGGRLPSTTGQDWRFVAAMA